MADPTSANVDTDSTHTKTQSYSYRVLDAARKKAFKARKYDSKKTRADLQAIFRRRYGKPAYEWQIDVTEAILRVSLLDKNKNRLFGRVEYNFGADHSDFSRSDPNFNWWIEIWSL